MRRLSVIIEAVPGAGISHDIGTLTRVSGIGKKGAERLILELRDRIGPVPVSLDTPAGRPGVSWSEQVRQALVGLGWAASQADQAVTAMYSGSEMADTGWSFVLEPQATCTTLL